MLILLHKKQFELLNRNLPSKAYFLLDVQPENKTG